MINIVVVIFIAILLSKQGKVEKVIEKLKVILFIFLFLLAIVFNNIYIWDVENHLKDGSIFMKIVFSAILAMIVCLYLSFAINLNIKPGQAKVMYYDGEVNRNIYIYFKYNDDYFVAGEKENIEDCKEYYFMKIDGIIGKELKRVLLEENNYSEVCCENIILQVEGVQDIILQDVINKVIEILQKNEIGISEYRETQIYIKPKDRMVYFHLPSEKIAQSKQKFSI